MGSPPTVRARCDGDRCGCRSDGTIREAESCADDGCCRRRRRQGGDGAAAAVAAAVAASTGISAARRGSTRRRCSDDVAAVESSFARLSEGDLVPRSPSLGEPSSSEAVGSPRSALHDAVPIRRAAAPCGGGAGSADAPGHRHQDDDDDHGQAAAASGQRRRRHQGEDAPRRLRRDVAAGRGGRQGPAATTMERHAAAPSI